MPASCAAATTSVPAGTVSLWPSMVRFISCAPCARTGASGMGERSLHGEDVVQAVLLGLVSAVPHRRLDPPTGGVAEPAKAAAVLEAVRDPLEDPELDLRALAGEDSLVRAHRPAAADAVRRALAA